MLLIFNELNFLHPFWEQNVFQQTYVFRIQQKCVDFHGLIWKWLCQVADV
jgi:hypothetical protein